jgi:hypothetical protein
VFFLYTQDVNNISNLVTHFYASKGSGNLYFVVPFPRGRITLEKQQPKQVNNRSHKLCYIGHNSFVISVQTQEYQVGGDIQVPRTSTFVRCRLQQYGLLKMFVSVKDFKYMKGMSHRGATEY